MKPAQTPPLRLPAPDFAMCYLGIPGRNIPWPGVVRPILVALGLATFLPAQTQTESPATAATAPDGETVMLSPFQVDASAEKGYLATQTLSGTRLKTDLRDLGSALTIFTEQLMDDLGANNLNDILAFAPNTDAFVNRLADVSGAGTDFINNPTQYVTRGGSTTVVGQDFFSNNIPGDRYNSEAFTFTRGPNAILFGLGNPAGAFVSSTKRARNKTATTLELKTDDRESFRATVDHNQVIKKNLLTLRYAGLYDKTRGFRIPSESFQRRHFLTARFTPFRRTTIRVNYEQGFLQLPAMRPWPIYDGISPWLAAGSPLLATPTSPRPAAIANYISAGPVSTQFSPAGTRIPTQRLTQGRSAVASYANGFPASNNKRSFIDPSVYPTLASSHGTLSVRETDYKVTSAFLEQEITRNFFVEAAINRVVADVFAVNGFVGDQDTLYVDVNRQLPNGTPNPNVGMLYTESRTAVSVNPSESLGKRLMSSYELDFSRQQSNWLRHLGRHRAAVFVEESDQKSYTSAMGIYNTTPLATTGAAAAITNSNNQIYYRYYYDPAAGKVGNTGGQFKTFPILYANDPLPPPDPSGITPAFVTQSGPTASDSTIATRAFALQSTFWKDRLIVTNGFRRDNQRAWRAIASDFVPFRDGRGLAINPSGFDIRKLFPDSLRERDGGTYTRGAVLHALPWLSFTYNTSNNFQANDSTRNVFGDLLPNPQGKGSDYGVKLALWERRLAFELLYYTNAHQDKIETVANTPAGDFRTLDRIWEAVADFTGDTKYRDGLPYASGPTGWSDQATTQSRGWEFSATANPTKQWRLTVNGSKRSTSTTTARGVYIRQYLAHYLPILRTPVWQALPTRANLTVAENVAMLETTLANFEAIKGLPEDVYAPNWTLNLIQTYAFAADSRLTGFSIGGSMNARGRTIDGFAEDAANVVVPTQPYYAPTYELFGAWITYQRKLFRNRLDWRLQLNVRNLFDAYSVFPLRTVDARDGTHRGVTAIYRLNEPRTYTFTSTLKF